MNTTLAHIVIAIAIVIIVALLIVCAFVAFRMISRAANSPAKKQVAEKKKRPIPEIEDIDINTIFKRKVR